MRAAPLVLLLGVASPALADDPQWYVGLPVAGVALQAPDGGLPDADLEPLLRAKQGDTADPRLLGTDLVTLFRVGEFAAVEVDVQPWFTQTPTGELAPAAMLTYLVYAAPKASQVRVQGTGEVRGRKLRAAAGVDLGAPFYLELDGPRVEQRIRSWLASEGYPDATVEVDAQDLGEGESEVWIRVWEGPPRTVGRVSFVADDLWAERERHYHEQGVGEARLERVRQREERTWERRLTRWAASAGVKEGQPVSPEALEAARFEIRRRLAELPPWWRRTAGRPDAGGWVTARVPKAAVLQVEGGEQLVTWTVEPGPRLELEIDGLGWRARPKTVAALGIDSRLRLTRGWVEAAPERMDGWLQERGYLDARSTVELNTDEEELVQVLSVGVDKGPLHTLRRFNGRYVLDGADSLDHAALRTVMDQASPEVLKRGRVTPEEVVVALRAVEEYYRAHGFLEAELTLTRLETVPYWSMGPIRVPVRTPAEGGRRRNVRVVAAASEGAQARLAGFGIQGAAEDVDIAAHEASGLEMLDEPFSPQSLEMLARRAVEAHREAGYLLADARVSSRRQEDGDYVSSIAVNPGPQVLLRSVTVRGARRTRARLVRGELDSHLVLGQPLTSTQLEQSRRALYETGAFRSVNTELLGERDAGDLLVNVSERPRYSLETGLGLATDQGFRGYARGVRSNWLGLAHRGELFLQLGFEWRSDVWYEPIPEWREPEWRAAFTYTAPRFPSRSQQTVLDLLFRELEQERTWRLARSGVGLSLETSLPTRTELRTAARLEGRQLEEVDPGVLLAGEPWVAILDPDKDELPSRWRLQDVVSVQLRQDLRDNPLQPRAGAVVSLLGDWVPGLVGTEGTRVPYVKGEARLSGWIPLARGGGPVLHLSGAAGRAWMLSEGVLALEDRYRLGGTASLRGFRRDGVGPRNQISQVDTEWPDALGPLVDHVLATDPDRWVTTGGDTRAAATVELYLPLPWLGLRSWDGWGATLFADTGNVWLLAPGATATSEQPRYQDAYDLPFRYGAGAGVRVDTPVGPLQVDLATNVESLTATDERRTLLREDWEEPPFRLHLSLGALW